MFLFMHMRMHVRYPLRSLGEIQMDDANVSWQGPSNDIHIRQACNTYAPHNYPQMET